MQNTIKIGSISPSNFILVSILLFSAQNFLDPHSINADKFLKTPYRHVLTIFTPVKYISIQNYFTGIKYNVGVHIIITL